MEGTMFLEKDALFQGSIIPPRASPQLPLIKSQGHATLSEGLPTGIRHSLDQGEMGVHRMALLLVQNI
jgi:hypothetical protein